MSDLNHISPPIGVHIRTEDYIDGLKGKAPEVMYKKFPAEAASLAKPPKSLETIKWHYHTKPPEQFLATVPWGRVYGTNGSVIASDNKLLWDVSFEYHTFPKSHSIYNQNKLPPITYIPETLAAITFQVSFNYFHWMFDVLPRIHLLRQSKVEFDRFVINRGIEYRANQCDFQDESLELMGITKEKWIECKADTHLMAKQLIVSSPAGYTAHVPKNVCQFLRNEFLEKRDIQKRAGYERVFISREDALHRKLINEEEVFHVLEEHGFKKVSLSTMSFLEKIQLFHTAEVIVSPHGAGLTNLVFCNPGTRVIELFPATYLMPCFYIISQHMNLDYYCMKGETVPFHGAGHTHKESFVIDIEKLEKTLAMAEID
jgi:capsular polysaccharide biosynthesis protein